MSNEIQDPGIGTKFNKRTLPIINKDGSYNVLKIGSQKGFRDVFKYMQEISWVKFFIILFLGYLVMNLIFTVLYALCGYDCISGIDPEKGNYFFQTFFFSVQTFTTVGYGAMSPHGLSAQIISTIEAFVGFLSFSLATGLAYGRFSKPNSKIIFSDNILFSKYKEGYGIKVRLANERDNVLLDVTAKMILTLDNELENGQISKSYYNLPLEINHVELLPYTWTLVHPVDEESPLWEKSKDEIMKANPDFLILIKGFDETFSQHVHTKSSYMVEDMLWYKRFVKIYSPNENGMIQFDINDINKMADEE